MWPEGPSNCLPLSHTLRMSPSDTHTYQQTPTEAADRTSHTVVSEMPERIQSGRHCIICDEGLELPLRALVSAACVCVCVTDGGAVYDACIEMTKIGFHFGTLTHKEVGRLSLFCVYLCCPATAVAKMLRSSGRFSEERMSDVPQTL